MGIKPDDTWSFTDDGVINIFNKGVFVGVAFRCRHKPSTLVTYRKVEGEMESKMVEDVVEAIGWLREFDDLFVLPSYFRNNVR